MVTCLLPCADAAAADKGARNAPTDRGGGGAAPACLAAAAAAAAARAREDI